ncbi:hypothetical protein GYMLUDRAFT_255303 [Collybiopsis luxurians FD-317 M1]|nr:hypothetical protein GYMLUDRAFT_255303 [Collybiopsis luxurians FD-317 M1]
MSSPNPPRKLAKIHLGLPETASHALIPEQYLEELSNHLAIYPNDTNFKLTPQPNQGFGKLTCLENGCMVDIPLQSNSKLSDGGKSIGIGSLTAYRAHITQHPTHSRNRLARVRAHSNGSSSAPIPRTGRLIKKEPSAVDLRTTRDAQPVLPSSPDVRQISALPLRPSQNRRTSQQLIINTNAAPTLISSDSDTSPLPRFSSSSPARKRSASPDQTESSSPIVNLPHPAKRLKKEPTPKTPLATSTNTVVPSSPTHLALDLHDVRSKIEELQREISHKQELLDRALRKDDRTTSDKTRIQRMSDEIATLRFLKDDLKGSLPVMSPVKRSSSWMKAEWDGVSSSSNSPAPIEAGPSRLPWYTSLKSESLDFFSDVSRHVVPKAEPFPARIPPSPMVHMKSEPVAWTLTPVIPAKPEPVPAQINLPVIPTQSESASAWPFYPHIDAVAGPSNPQAHQLSLGNASLDGDYAMRFETSDTYAANTIATQYAGTYIPNVAPMMFDEGKYDQEGNFRGRGRDTFQGPVARADDIEKFLVEAGNAATFDHNATVDQALKALGLPSLYTPLPGMEIALMAHQAIGVAWMLDKERSSIRGGTLADEMGLGKTVQLIAMMMMNRSQDPKCKTTLILAPTALLDQWKQELELKTNVNLKCYIYHGPNKPKKADDLLKYDVVLTTFQTMALEWLDIEGEEKKKKKKAKAKAKGEDFIVSDSDNDGNLKSKKKKKENGLLFQVEFYRVVLDEAQNIRNKMTRASRAVTALNAQYRWCLTGTPIINSLLDSYGIIRFLRITPWHDFQHFHPHISRLEKKNPQLAITRLQAILNTFMLRRKKDSKLDGKILIELPPKDITLQRLEFSEEEREIYDAVEKRMQTQFNRFLKAGTVLKNYSTVLVLLLRLRQCCVHPSLIQEEGVAFVAADEVDDAGKVLKRARDLVSDEFVRKLKAKFLEQALSRMRAEKESQDATIETEECPICYDNFSNPVITACQHNYCHDCIKDVLNAPLAEPTHDEPAQYKQDERPCPVCRNPISRNLLFEQAAFMPTDEELMEVDGTGERVDSDVEMEDATVTSKGKGKRKSKPKKKAGHPIILGSDDEDIIDVDAIQTEESESEDDDHDMSDFIVQSDEDDEEKDARKALKKRLGKRKAIVILDSDEEEEEEKEILFGKSKAKKLSPEAIKLLPRFLPSTKMKWMIEHIRRLFEERPNEKILVVSQWTSCLSLVSQYLGEHDILHVKYQGDMNRKKRDASVRSFMSKDKARIMLMSLKCGGVGLNLVRGNNVISLDLAWSQAIEAQAFDRVHRLGQTLPVKVERLVIENTVEDRILAMQERKQTLADGSLGEGNAKKISKMTVKQLAALFGLDGHGRLLPQTAGRESKGKEKAENRENAN